MPTCCPSACWRPTRAGRARHTRLTPDEQRTQLTLLAIARAPLILGANLTQLDADTRRLITNKDVIAIDQTARDNHPVENLPAGFEKCACGSLPEPGDSSRFASLPCSISMTNLPPWRHPGTNWACLPAPSSRATCGRVTACPHPTLKI